jgi:hypothetical protein
MKTTTLLLPAAALLALSACAQPEHLGADFGNAVEQNMSMHIINPSPVYIAPEVPDMEGNRAAGALDRYQAGGETEVEAVRTTDVGTE